MPNQFAKMFFLSFLFFSQTLLAQNTNYDLLLQSGKTLLSENGHKLNNLPAPNEAELFEGYYLRLIQFYELPERNAKTKLRNTGIRFLDYIPNKAFITAIPENFDWTKLAGANIRSVAAIQTKWKMGENLRNETYGDWALDGNHLDVTFTFPEMYNIKQLEIACIEHGITILETSRYNPIVKAQIPIDEITRIAALPFIHFLEMKQAPPKPADIRGRSLHRSNMVDSQSPSGYHFNGEGVNVQVRDNGSIGSHIDFQGRVNNSFESTGQAGDHQTPVSGTLGGGGNLDPNAKGMADGAFIYATTYEASHTDISMDLHFNREVVITNNSYAVGCNNYSNNTRTVDQQIYANPTLIHVYAAGNANSENCGYGAGNQWGNITGGPSQGKNIITAGATNSSGQITDFSSRGPARDGRIKPDLSAQGSGVYTPQIGNDYVNTQGTSFSSPNVAGVLAQLYQAYKTWNNGENPESALIKASLLNTANDLGHTGPDYIYGWGHLNAFRAMKIIEENRYFDDVVEQNESIEHILTIPPDVKQARIMVYWSDFPGSPVSAKALVNDLDMELSTFDGEVLLPYILNPTPNATTLNAPATHGIDNLNNMEQVLINLPSAGDYTLTVKGTEIPFGNQKYYVLWELITDDIMLTYPNGGECFSSTGSQVIHWDAHSKDGSFLLEYSLDNGAIWETITTRPGNTRLYSWGGA